jgi:hypothetical protein
MTRLSWKIVILGALAGCMPARVLEAQVLSQVGELEQVQRVNELERPQGPQSSVDSVPPLYPGEEQDSGRQLLLETAPRPHWDWVNINLDTQYFYTSNALLANTGRKPTGLLVSTAAAMLAAPPIVVPYGNLFTRLGYQYQWFNFGLGGPGQHLNDIDFDAATVSLEAEYDLAHQWSIFGSLDYTRLLSEGNDLDEFYKELVPTVGVEKIYQFRTNAQLSVAYSGNYRFTDEVPFPSQGRGANNRTDQALSFVLNWQVAPKVIIRPFYRFQYSYYPDFFAGSHRNDLLNTLGVSANYCFNSWSSMRLFLTYDFFNSDASTVPNYRKLDVGGGLSVGLKF